MGNYIESIIDNLSHSAFESTLLASITGLFALLALRALTASLLKMHRSKSSLKKLNKQYSFGKKIMMKPARDYCIHAPRFCACLIYCHHTRCVLFIVNLLLGFIHRIQPSFGYLHTLFSVAVCFFFDVFVLTLNLVLLKNPFVKRKNSYRFEKYHNTQEHNKLF